ncbi:tyrosine-protein phosphatase [Promicromonospora thailandica]|uniref:Protein tyrosine/serine phosphatase n=1 Tax=Promicromonospora thailandica TaxID=765201 RepID=A0A9X2G4W6_9MICO|nr:tyrosine-protein phosphatase [Promicromonospora thailandica]MCP2265377.1 Protein tyrosine/serine phosphatase [Promicromonospora thailandica]
MSNPANRTAWDGAVNLRDLGGLPLEDGGVTAHGRVWRSGAPEPITAAGWARAVADGLTTVVDLRNPAEIKQARDLMPSAMPAAVVVRSTPTEDMGDPHFLAACGPWLDHPRSYAPTTAMYPHLVGRALRAVADAEGPVLVHCSAGRDRTGMVAAMLLVLAGVEHQAIAADYEGAFRGTSHRGGGVAYDVERGAWVQHPGETWTPQQMDARVRERRAALLEWLADLDPVAYLRYAGLDEGRIRGLRERLR